MTTSDPNSTMAVSRPRALGLAYAKLWSAGSVSYLGDGIYYTALPLLAASLSRDPLIVATVQVAGEAPWLLFALPAGALVDRWDRRRVLWIADAYRSLVVTALAVAIVAGWTSIAVLGATGFLLAIGGTLFNPAALSIVPAIVSREPDRLERANGRLAAAQTIGEHFLGPPVGGVLFSLAHSVPFLAEAVSFAVSSALIASIRGRFASTTHHAQGPARSAGKRPSLRGEIVEGLRWLAGHRLLRALAVMVAIASLAFSAWSSIMVLFAQDRLGLGAVGFGLLWTGVAAGSLFGGLLAGRLGRTFGESRLLLLSATSFGATTLGIGFTASPWVAGILLGVLGLALTVWNVVVISLRQAIVPDRLIGRVNSAFQQLSFGMLPLGSALGGTLGRTLGLRAPFLISDVTLLVIAALAVPVLTARAIQAARASASRPDSGDAALPGVSRSRR
jgi:MFS family permease